MKENKEVMAANIRYFMELYKVNSADVCKALGFKQNTFSNWINAKIYPRIDKIEMMAKYFGIEKSDLVEERPRYINSPEEFEKEWQDAGGGAHPNYKVGWGPHGPLHKVICTAEEEKIILAYRTADSFDQLFIRRILKLDAGEKDNSSLA